MEKTNDLKAKIEEIKNKYSLRLTSAGKLTADPAVKKDRTAFSFVGGHKAEVIEYLRAEAEAKRKAEEERQKKIDAIDGLMEIRRARADMDAWHDEFATSFNDVGGLCVRKKPEYDFAALEKKYPRAAAYLMAEAWECSAHWAKSAAGRKAKDRIINDEDPDTVIAEMKAEWDAFTTVD